MSESAYLGICSFILFNLWLVGALLQPDKEIAIKMVTVSAFYLVALVIVGILVIKP